MDFESILSKFYDTLIILSTHLLGMHFANVSYIIHLQLSLNHSKKIDGMELDVQVTNTLLLINFSY